MGQFANDPGPARGQKPRAWLVAVIVVAVIAVIVLHLTGVVGPQ
jgi:hypothetical protein